MQISHYIGTMLSLIIGLIDPIAAQFLWRLPIDITPHSYSIHITTNVHTQTDFTFHGDINITFTPLFDDITAITMHAKMMSLDSAEVWRIADVTNNTQIAPIMNMPRRTYDRDTEMMTVHLKESDGVYTIGVPYVMRLKYNSDLRETGLGFYRTAYQMADGQLRWLATTQFGTVDARHAFPCLDEPALRATFVVRITHGSGYSAISNMPVDGVPSVR